MTLKPCPFCGHEVNAYRNPYGSWFISCDCGCIKQGYADRESAIMAWNRRASGILRIPSEEEWMERFCTPKQFEGYKKRKEMKNGED